MFRPRAGWLPFGLVGFDRLVFHGRTGCSFEVTRALQSTHFQHLSPASLLHKVVDGHTLRQELTARYHNLARGEQRIGSTVFAELARRYSEGDSSVEALTVQNQDGQTDD